MGTKKVIALLVVALLAAAACGADDDTADENSVETTTTGAPTDDDTAGDDIADDAGSTGIGACSESQRPDAASYSVTDIADDDPDGGLVARLLPGADEVEIDVLAEGTVVDARSDADACAVTDDGAVWWDIGTPQLATGGWVNSKFLSAGATTPDTDQDSYDVDKARIACIYDGDAGACDLLEQDGFTAQGNYGLGNSYSMAPDEAISAQCDEGDEIACAEQESRKG